MEQFNYVYSPPTMASLQDRIKELNDLVDLLRAQMRDQNMRTRDRFAMAALTGMLAGGGYDIPGAAADAFLYADALMKRRTEDR